MSSLKKYSILIILLIFVFSFFFYKKNFIFSPIGVIDKEKIVKNDPRYFRIAQLDKQNKMLLKNIKEDIILLTHHENYKIEELFKKILQGEEEIYKKEISLKYISFLKRRNDFIEELKKEMNKKIILKKEEEDKKSVEEILNFEENQKMEFTNFKQKIKEEYYLPKLNLVLKLKTLNLTPEEKREIENKLKNLNEEEKEKLGKEEKRMHDELNLFKGKKEKEIEENIKNYQEILRKEGEEKILLFDKKEEDKIKDYINITKNTLGDEIKSKEEILNLYYKLDFSNQHVLRRIKERKREIEKLKNNKLEIKNEILEDYRTILGNIAKERKIELVLSNYIVNINALNLTEEIIRRTKFRD